MFDLLADADVSCASGASRASIGRASIGRASIGRPSIGRMSIEPSVSSFVTNFQLKALCSLAILVDFQYPGHPS